MIRKACPGTYLILNLYQWARGRQRVPSCQVCSGAPNWRCGKRANKLKGSHPLGPRQDGVMGWPEPHKIQQGQM